MGSLENQVLNSDYTAFPFCLLGIFVGIFSGAWTIYYISWLTKGALPLWATCLCVVAFMGAALAIFVVLVSSGVIQYVALDHWSDIVDYLSDIGYRYHDNERCKTYLCKRITAFLVTLAQTWLINGTNFAIFLFGACCISSWFSQHPYLTGSLGIATLIVVTSIIVTTTSGYGGTGSTDTLLRLPGTQHLFAVIVFHLTQICARCVVPIGAIWANASHLGVCVIKRESHDSNHGKVCHDEEKTEHSSEAAVVRYTVFV